MKAIICMQGKADIGKTQTLREVYELLDSQEKNILEQQNDDICATVQMDDFLIGISTQGDPLSSQDEWILNLVHKSCDIIVCASRTKGTTVEFVKNCALQNDYSLIWSSPFVVENEKFSKICHKLMASSIINLINSIAYV